jgi:hypothetical protein
MLKSIVRSPSSGAERLLADQASISTASPPTGLIETKTDDIYRSGFSRWLAVPVRGSGEFSWFTRT